MFPYETTSLCKVCKTSLPATVLSRSGEGAREEVFLVKRCPEHGHQEVRLSDDAGWYARTRSYAPKLRKPRHIAKEIEHGCPFDCGACAQHEASVRLPVVTITSSCNLDCPICYVYNKNEDAFFMGREEFAAVLDRLVEEHGSDIELLNLTGGEPTLHPDLRGFLEMANARGIHRISLCTNGIAIARDERLAAALAAMGARIALSFDSFEEHADYVMQGAHLVELKMRALQRLEQHQVNTTLIPVMARGLNEHEVGRILRFAMGLRCVRHVEIHTMTYTGQSGTSFGPERSARISMREVLALIEQTTEGWLKVDDFVPSPCAHPLCYQVSYVLVDPDGGEPIPFARFLSRETIYECLADRLYLEPSERLERAFREAIDRLWAFDGDQRLLALLKGLIARMFPTDRELTEAESLRISEDAVKAVYVHSHMDEETFDTERIRQCCDSDCFVDGTTIPVCAYNILYRDKMPRFMAQPKAWGVRSGRRF